MVYNDVPEAVEEEFNRWYNEEHVPERRSIPGVLNAARYVAVRGACPIDNSWVGFDSLGWASVQVHPSLGALGELMGRQ